jgi:photosynthetic reaction center cytochrome c subunit
MRSTNDPVPHPVRKATTPVVLAVAAMTLVWLVSVTLAARDRVDSSSPQQAASSQKLPMSEEAFKNIQALKGISVDDFMQTMGIMSASLGFDCQECHVGAGTDSVDWAFDTPRKRTARKMVDMVTAINRDNFSGRQVVTCWSCHRGRDRPVMTPSIETVYGTPILEADDVFGQASGMPTPESILDKYIQAVGGAQKLAAFTSFTAKGTSLGFRGFGGGGEVEVYAKAPDQRATRVHYQDADRGDVNRTFDGRAGWLATPLTVLPRYALTGGELDGAKLDAQLTFPGQIKQVLSGWRVGNPKTINKRDNFVVQGNGARGLVATLYFDRETGLLTRFVRYARTPIGRAPTQIDFADYRDVDGIKVPFRWTMGWLDGLDTFELTDVKLNVPIDLARFSQPPASAPKR